MSWKFQNLLWKVLPEDRSVDFTAVIFGTLLALLMLAFLFGWITRRSRWKRTAVGAALVMSLSWIVLYATRPPWLRVASMDPVPAPVNHSPIEWRTRAPGLETTETDLYVKQTKVDRMVLVRMDPERYELSVRWDPTGTRTAEDWQKELGAAVVTNGSYFSESFSPLTPLRISGEAAGPSTYSSTHGALVVRGTSADILDLREKDALRTITAYPEAMVSYPLLLDPDGKNRAVDSKTWLASRNFVGIDRRGWVVFGATKTGFFTIHRLGEFLKHPALDLRAALNLDGGPLVGQVVEAGGYSRRFHGTAEISRSADSLRVLWHEKSPTNWTLPIVLVATPRERIGE
ncbi:MAG: phosphodiester glycosidase family protein [Akkermansiaceae bacterium]|nr:phosphodiester glycosidase family protein [Akkermansiaceae bacterium]